MEFISKELDTYVSEHTSEESQLLEQLNRDTWANVMMPRMLSGHLQGRVLSMITQMIRPKRVLEIGTYTGYSALCMAEGLADDGVLHTIDINEELEDMVRGYIDEARLTDKVHYHIGNAIDIIPQLNEEWDMVFIDADKENYWQYYEMTFPRVRKGGFIIADNVLWSGKVLMEDEKKPDKDTRAIMEFNQKVHLDNRVENVLFPIRDGLMVVRKK